MIEIKPSALYSRADLIELLKPMGINADSFIARIRPVKRFQRAWVGKDLIEAIGSAGQLERRAQVVPVKPPSRRRGRPRKGAPANGEMIGSFRKDELGFSG